ncbi:MAG: NAD(P)H-dependent oxidoreductase subunit E [Christensenellales bacterium]|jgi:NADP-reducing hydrogenase subunit HndA
MQNTKTKIPFEGSAEQEKQLLSVINGLKSQRGSLMPILQQAQDIYGYLPIEVQTIIARELKIPIEEVYGVVTFYSQFALNPKGKYRIAVCLGTACYVKGAGDIFDGFSQRLGIQSGECTEDGQFSLEACRCIGACGLAPVLMVNDEDVFGQVTVDELDDIIGKYRA